jgi:hypothetical protein
VVHIAMVGQLLDQLRQPSTPTARCITMSHATLYKQATGLTAALHSSSTWKT